MQVALSLLAALQLQLAPQPSVELRGRAVNERGAPVLSAMVTAVNVRTEFGGVAYTDSQGNFALQDLPAGSYLVFVELRGYAIFEDSIALSAPPAVRRLDDIVLQRVLGGQPAGAQIPRPKNFDTVDLLYGTDRAQLPSQGRTTYGARRGQLDVGIVSVSIPRDHRIGALEGRSIWKLEFRPDPAKHVVVIEARSTAQAAFQRTLRAQAAKAQSRSGVLFVHGYNVGFDDAARRAAQISYDLQNGAVPLLYSWPSNGDLLDYVADQEQAKRAARYLREFLDLVMTTGALTDLHIIAHSMGNQVLAAALSEGGASHSGTRLAQVALVAPDIDAEVFVRDLAPRINGVARRLTLYASTRDRALMASKKLHAYPRIGDLSDGVTVMDGIDTIDASDVDTGLLGHSYYADNRSVISDLFHLVRSGAPPPERFGMRPMSVSGKRYWKFAP